MRRLAMYLVAMLALTTALGAGLVSAPATAAQTAGSLTIYNAVCPAGYTGTAYFQDCFDNPGAGTEFAVNNFKSEFNASGTTDANGFVTLPLPVDPAGGAVSVGTVPPGEVPGGAPPPFAAVCSMNGADVPVSYSLIQLDPGGDAYTISIPVAAGDQIRCDWYSLAASAAPPPAQPVDGDASLTIYKMTCPADFDDYFEDCFDQPAADVDFAAGTPNTDNVATGATDANGFVTFSLNQFDLNPTAPDTVSVGEFDSGAVAEYFVVCSKNDGAETVPFEYATIPFEPGGPLLAINLAFSPGDQIRCDWYNVPADAPAPTPAPTSTPAAPSGPVSQLPNTGTGSQGGATSFLVWPLAALLLLVGTATAGRRRPVSR